MLAKVRVALWVLVGIAAIGGAYLSLRAPDQGASKSTATEMPLRSIGGPFALTGSDGLPFSSQRLAGRPYAIFFGFTHCPDVCPTTLSRLVKLRKDLNRGSDSFAIVFVTVDPERDGPKEVGAYSNLFGTPVIGLTGSTAAIEKVKQQFGVYAKKTGSAPEYSVNHTATTFLIDRNGKFASTISAEENQAIALEKLNNLLD